MMRFAVAAILGLAVAAGAQTFESGGSPSKIRRQFSASAPLSYNSTSGAISFPSFTPTTTATVTQTPTITRTPSPTPTSVLPLAQGGTNNGSLGNSPDGQVLRVIAGAVTNDTIPQVSITSAFDVYVDINGTDSSTCGPINKPCKTITGTDGAHAKILANNDNGFATCYNDRSQGCGRCAGGSNDGTACNEDADCAGGGICSDLTCSGNSATACYGTCSVTSSTKCNSSTDCPSGETCAVAGGGSCGGGSCAAGNSNSRCASSSTCVGPAKTYLVHIGAGTYSETLAKTCAGGANSGLGCVADSDCPSSTCSVAGTTQIPSPGYITYAGAGRNATAIQSARAATIDLTSRSNMLIRDLQVENTSNGDAVRSTGSARNTGVTDAAMVHWGTGWDYNFTGWGNVTNGITNTWTFGFGTSSSDHSVHFQPTGTSCSTTTTRACAVNGDCPGGETCSLAGSNDWGIMGSFIQAGPINSGDGTVWVEGKSCGSAFNILITDTDIQQGSSQTTANQGKALRISQTDCDSSSPSAYKNVTRLTTRALRISPNDVIPLSAADFSIDIGENTTLANYGLLQYDACRRNISGTLAYVDPVPGTTFGSRRWGGAGYLGVLECDTPQTTSLDSPSITSVLNSTTGGSLAGTFTTYYYKVTATNATGESMPSSGYGVIGGTCGGTCKNTITWRAVSGATGYKVYGRPGSIGGTYQLIATVSGNSTNSYVDDSGSPSGAIPTTDTSYTANPQAGEMWYSTTLGKLRWYDSTTNNVASVSYVDNTTKSIGFPAGGYSVDGAQCTTPTERTINSGPKRFMMNCANNASAAFYGDAVLPDGYSGSTLTFKLSAESEAGSPSGNLAIDYACKCVRSGDTINSTWGTAQTATLTFATQYKEQQGTTAEVTCNGTCAGGAHLYWRGIMNTGSTTATLTNVYLLDTTLEYPRNAVTD